MFDHATHFIADANLSITPEMMGETITVPIPVEYQAYFTTEDKFGKPETPQFIELYGYMLTEDTAAYLGRPVVYARTVEEARLLVAVFAYLLHAYEEADETTDPDHNNPE